MTWEEWLRERLPLDRSGNIHLRDIQASVLLRGREAPVVLHETVEPAKIVELFGVELGSAPPDGPLPEATYQVVLAKADAMGSPLWRQHWERWRAEGRV